MSAKMDYLFLILALQIICSVKAQTIQPKSLNRQGKDLHYYYHPEGDIKSDYPPITYNPNYSREGLLECPPNPFSTFIGRGINFLLLKLGAVALVKAILAALVLFKIPLFFLKMVFLKTFLFPVLIAPLLLHLFTNQQSQEMRPPEMEDHTPEMTNNGMGRYIAEDLSKRVWRSMKVFAESEQCVERVACAIGAYNKESSDGKTFTRVLKLFELSSPSSVRDRFNSIMEAFKSGVRNGFCLEQDFTCHGPELFIQQGNEKMQLL